MSHQEEISEKLKADIDQINREMTDLDRLKKQKRAKVKQLRKALRILNSAIKEEQ
jgi:hypothetical protein